MFVPSSIILWIICGKKRTCDALGLIYVQPNGVSPGGPDVPLTIPNGVICIDGDGTCFFRAISVVITGSQDQHMALRQATVKHTRTLGQSLVRYLDPIYTEGGIDHYLEHRKMYRCGVWATEIEIFTLSHLLNTSIYDYLPSMSRTSSDQSVAHPGEWSRTIPRHVDRTLPPPNDDDMGIYIRLLHHHFEVIRSIHQ